jgi:hypothetical protein
VLLSLVAVCWGYCFAREGFSRVQGQGSTVVLQSSTHSVVAGGYCVLSSLLLFCSSCLQQLLTASTLLQRACLAAFAQCLAYVQCTAAYMGTVVHFGLSVAVACESLQ